MCSKFGIWRCVLEVGRMVLNWGMTDLMLVGWSEWLVSWKFLRKWWPESLLLWLWLHLNSPHVSHRSRSNWGHVWLIHEHGLCVEWVLRVICRRWVLWVIGWVLVIGRRKEVRVRWMSVRMRMWGSELWVMRLVEGLVLRVRLGLELRMRERWVWIWLGLDWLWCEMEGLYWLVLRLI
jgi:hypothetical protein